MTSENENITQAKYVFIKDIITNILAFWKQEQTSNIRWLSKKLPWCLKAEAINSRWHLIYLVLEYCSRWNTACSINMQDSSKKTQEAEQLWKIIVKCKWQLLRYSIKINDKLLTCVAENPCTHACVHRHSRTVKLNVDED